MSQVALEFSDFALVGICLLGIVKRLQRQRSPLSFHHHATSSTGSSSILCHYSHFSADSFSLATNLLSLVSNFLTYLLRHSQVLYALILAVGDCVFSPSSVSTCAGGASGPSPSSSLNKQQRQRVHYYVQLPALAFLVALLSVLHYFRMLFFVGEVCGYTACLLNLFSIGIELSSGGLDAAPPSGVLACHLVCSCIYLYMITQEGEALYSSHIDWMRWYGNTLAAIVLDLLRMRRTSLLSLTV